MTTAHDALAALVRGRFGDDAAAISYSTDDGPDVTLWDVRDRAGRMLWDAEVRAHVWPELPRVAELFAAVAERLPYRGDGLLYRLDDDAAASN